MARGEEIWKGVARSAEGYQWLAGRMIALCDQFATAVGQSLSNMHCLPTSEPIIGNYESVRNERLRLQRERLEAMSEAEITERFKRLNGLHDFQWRCFMEGEAAPPEPPASQR